MVIKQNSSYKLPFSKKEIIDKYQQGLSCYAIAKMCNCSASNIFSILKKANIQTRSLSQAATKYTLNHNYFDKIDNEEKAYFLGFLYADGNVINKKVTLCLQEKDKHILDCFKNSLQYTGPITINNKTGNRQTQFKLVITSELLVKALNIHGVYPHKAFNLSFPANLPKNYYNHFIRGYFDGDGCIYIHQNKTDYLISMIGPKIFLESIQTILVDSVKVNRTKLYNPKNCKENGLHTLTYQGRKNVIKIGDFLYKNATCFLNRKHSKYLACYD
jgi:intein-encoded DNA endonuclease-like protein